MRVSRKPYPPTTFLSYHSEWGREYCSGCCLKVFPTAPSRAYPQTICRTYSPTITYLSPNNSPCHSDSTILEVMGNKHSLMYRLNSLMARVSWCTCTAWINEYHSLAT